MRREDDVRGREVSVFLASVSIMLGYRGPAGPASGSSAQRMQVHLHLLAAAQHPHGGVEASGGDGHLPAAHQLPVPGEKHLQDHRGGDSEFIWQSARLLH